MRFGLFLAALLFPLIALAGPGAQTACTTGQTTCVNDSTNERNLVVVQTDPAVQRRIYLLFMGQCQNIYSELTSVNGHANRVTFCQSIAAQKVPWDMLVAAVLSASPTVTSQALCTQGTTNDGCMVDVDINTAIGSVMTVTGASGLATRSWP